MNASVSDAEEYWLVLEVTLIKGWLSAFGNHSLLFRLIVSRDIHLHSPSIDTAPLLVKTPPYPMRKQAAQLAEDYWMALARDVPFSQYGTNEITTTAAGIV